MRACWDVLVVGGGHAGCEAAAAAARFGARTLLLTHRLDTIGETACNPSFGGIGKGHLMREVDALDGLCGRIADKAGVNFCVLNKKKGPAVWGLRAQVDRKLYKEYMQDELFNHTPNLVVQSGAVEDMMVEYDPKKQRKPSVVGVVLENGQKIHSKTLVITTGTFLRGEIFIGLTSRPAGRIGEDASYGLSTTLQRLGFRLGRLRTGTPPRLIRRTIDFAKLKPWPPDQKPVPFSFMNDKVLIEPDKQILSYIGETNQETHRLCVESMGENRHIKEETNAPRYCPSLESKLLRFKQHRLHQIWLEPEGLDVDLVYPQGLSMTYSPEVQQRIVNTIVGLGDARVARPGYGVVYDHVDARQLKTSLETKPADALFLAGQINGTTGYEEAAAQGLIAGTNAAIRAAFGDAEEREGTPLTVDRANSYLGVLVDDLTTQGADEPYRMFTSRAELRILLRPDNAEMRLTEIGRKAGVVGDDRWRAFSERKRRLQLALSTLTAERKAPGVWHDQHLSHLPLSTLAERRKTTSALKTPLQLIADYSLPFADVATTLYPRQLTPLLGDKRLVEQLKIEAKYAPFVNEARQRAEEMRREATTIIPETLDVALIEGLSKDIRCKLVSAAPQTMAAAARLPGMTPVAMTHILLAIRRHGSNSDVVQQNRQHTASEDQLVLTELLQNVPD